MVTWWKVAFRGSVITILCPCQTSIKLVQDYCRTTKIIAAGDSVWMVILSVYDR